MKSKLTLTNLRTPTIRTYGRFRNLSPEPWTYKKSFDISLGELQENALLEYSKLQQSAKNADKLIEKAEIKLLTPKVK